MPWDLEYGLQSAPVKLPEGIREGDAPQPFAVTEEQRQRLVEDGAIVIPGLLSEEWLEYLRGATDWQVRNPHFWSVAGVASGLYDYIQRSVWASNDAFVNFLYYSPLASALANVSNAEELRLSTDLLMVNPNKGFKWHQDNQNGPIDAFQEDFSALRWWVTMDDCPPDHGAPVYLKGSHRNTKVTSDMVRSAAMRARVCGAQRGKHSVWSGAAVMPPSARRCLMSTPVAPCCICSARADGDSSSLPPHRSRRLAD